jgi:hypothetical protein
VDEVDVIATGVDHSFLVGDPVSQNFDTDSGAKQYQLDFSPESRQFTYILFTVIVTLSNNCVYATDYILGVDGAVLNYTSEITKILNP